MTKTLLFEVYSDDHAWKIYSDGSTEGFPVPVCIVNRVMPLLHYAQALCEKAINGEKITAEQAARLYV